MRQLPLHQGEFTIAGKGRVLAFPASALPEDMVHPKEFLGTTVEVAGVPYEIAGVETHCVPDDVRYRLGFGLLVRTVQTTSADGSGLG